MIGTVYDLPDDWRSDVSLIVRVDDMYSLLLVQQMIGRTTDDVSQVLLPFLCAIYVFIQSSGSCDQIQL